MTHRNASKHNGKIGKGAKKLCVVIVWKWKTTSKSNINIVESFSKRADVEEKKPAVFQKLFLFGAQLIRLHLVSEAHIRFLCSHLN